MNDFGDRPPEFATAPAALDHAAVFAAAPDAYLLLSPEFTILGVTDPYLDVTMTDRETIVGRQLFDVFPDNPATPEAAGEHHVRSSLEKVLATGLTDVMPVLQYDIPLPGSDGEFETRYWSPRNSPVLAADGSVRYIIHRVEDVTDHVRLERTGARLERELHAVHEPARIAAAEYRRALRDYTQLIRHRIANPLTAITAGVVTLRDLDSILEPETRLEILDAMIETAARLEQAVLHPELASACEDDLAPIPTGVDADVAALIEIDAVKAEVHTRKINVKMAEQLHDSDNRIVEFFCECWAAECDGLISMPLGEYFAVHHRNDQFIICPGHDLPSIEDVIERQAERWVVRKTPEAIRAADMHPGPRIDGTR